MKKPHALGRYCLLVFYLPNLLANNKTYCGGDNQLLSTSIEIVEYFSLEGKLIGHGVLEVLY
jgi:hypothetical protein